MQMSKWPMWGHFRYLRFKTFSMTPRTPQCEVFWALLLSSEHSGVPEDSKSPTLEVLGFTPTLGQSGVATISLLQILSQLEVEVRSYERPKSRESKPGQFRDSTLGVMQRILYRGRWWLPPSPGRGESSESVLPVACPNTKVLQDAN
jgi:hypothetical protein